MPATFPALGSGYVAKYPLTRSNHFRSNVYLAIDMSEQRFSKGYALEEFSLIFDRIITTDKELLRAFWDAREGALDTTWTITLTDIDGTPVTYIGLQFMPGQDFEATEVGPGIWNVKFNVRQTRIV